MRVDKELPNLLGLNELIEDARELPDYFLDENLSPL
jgi:hypothetical protein